MSSSHQFIVMINYHDSILHAFVQRLSKYWRVQTHALLVSHKVYFFFAVRAISKYKPLADKFYLRQLQKLCAVSQQHRQPRSQGPLCNSGTSLRWWGEHWRQQNSSKTTFFLYCAWADHGRTQLDTAILYRAWLTIKRPPQKTEGPGVDTRWISEQLRLACERQTFLLAHRRWGTFREEERLRLSDRNSILMT